MTAFPHWLARVLDHGESVLDRRPEPSAADRGEVGRVLADAFRWHVLAVAGPAAVVRRTGGGGSVRRAGSRVLAAGERGGGAGRHACRSDFRRGPPVGRRGCFRFLPTVYRRAKARTDAALITGVETVLRRWPLSGVLAELDGEPAAALDFFGHPGLQLLYAERLTAAARPGWVPPAGPAREWAERVFADRGRPLPARPTPLETPA
jgi:hypothetical protein